MSNGSTPLPSAAAFGDYVRRFQPLIESALQSACQPSEGCPETLRQAMEYVLLAPGKRLRPMLVLLAAEACGGEPTTAMPAALAVEMVHAYSLVHDDLPAMDDDDLRRGRPTCHKVFGEAVAILAGDALLALAFEVLATQLAPPELAAACCAILAEAAGPRRLVGGQADDLQATAAGGNLDQLLAIHERKTGALIRAALCLGGRCAGADESQLARLAKYGQLLGLAFQITDDLLDARGCEKELGKRVGKDAARGKLTFPELLGIDQSASHAQQLVDEACEVIAPFGPRGAGLESLARFVLQRSR
jgi:geranylgeranyl diphosphate synthase type II